MESMMDVAELGVVVVVVLPALSGVSPTTERVAPMAIRRT